MRKFKSDFPYWVAALMPKWLVYYCTIRAISHATTGLYSSQVVPELLAVDVVKRWESA